METLKSSKFSGTGDGGEEQFLRGWQRERREGMKRPEQGMVVHIRQISFGNTAFVFLGMNKPERLGDRPVKRDRCSRVWEGDIFLGQGPKSNRDI